LAKSSYGKSPLWLHYKIDQKKSLELRDNEAVFSFPPSDMVQNAMQLLGL
jgi:hypothetical protein